jgi:hypothetical protein
MQLSSVRDGQERWNQFDERAQGRKRLFVVSKTVVPDICSREYNGTRFAKT